jgi:hypothetical protein
MSWVLLGLAILSPTEFDAYEIGRFDTMEACFETRDLVLVRTEAYSGIPNINEQYVCVKTEYK